MSSRLLDYRFGFVIYKNNATPNLEEVKDWKRLVVDDFQIYTHPEVNVEMVESSHGSAILIGEAFVCQGKKKVKDILEMMLKKDAWDAFDLITGRFALFLVNKNGTKILHDPFGSRTVYYMQGGEVGISSHSSLLASLFGEKFHQEAKSFIKLPEYKMRGTGYLPGDVTMYANIKALVPNNYYDVNERKTVRYWPRESISGISKRKFLKRCDEYLEKFTAYYAPKYKFLLGLTGGVDTRALIAGVMGHGAKPRLITWTAGRLPAKEVPIVEEMKEHLDCTHLYMDPSNEVLSEKFKELRLTANKATGFSRGPSRLTANMGEVVNDDEVFIRGFGGEIIRGFYSRHNSAMSGDLVTDFTKLYKTDRVKEPSKEFISFVEEATKGFIERANYNDNLFNIDIRDLFYWEQRMGAWAANMLNEMDPALYSIVGFNSRPLYAAAFGLSKQKRLGAEIMLDITSRYDKKFAEIGILS